MQIINAITRRIYNGGELVPRNSSVLVTRIPPRENAVKLPKVQ